MPKKNRTMKLASFDIFDTTLIRKCGKPENIFYLLAHKIYPNDRAKSEDFLLWRKNAEREARRKHPGKDVTIDDIYSSNELKGFDEYDKKELIEAEKSVEAEQLTANPAIRDIINGKREQGYTICFISDMYLPSTILKEVLAREGCIKEDENVYVSCEWNARKSNGKLYKKLKKELRPTEWEHYGDHHVSDVNMARKNGIRSTKVITDFSIPESKIMQSSTRCISNEISCLVGLQRAARIYFGDDGFSNMAASFVAPAYISYVHWVIEKCREENIERLYFLSRDSYILQQIAEEVPHEDIELKYLFVSRKSLLLPYMYNATAEKFLAVQDKKTIRGKDVESLLGSLGTSKAELSREYGITFRFNRITTKKEEETFLDSIFENESRFLHTLNERAREKRDLLNAYFKQEEVIGNGKNAMVDVGWLGTTRLMINSILKEEGCNETQFFYYGVRQDVLHSQHGRYMTFHDPGTSDTGLTFVIEDYFSASPYKTTLGYIYSGNRYNPKLAGETVYNKIVSSNSQICQWITKELRNYPNEILNILKYWEEVSINCTKNSIHQIDNTPLVESGISRKLNITEFCNIIFMGAHKTLYDKASIALTSSKHLFPLFWLIHNNSAKIRAILARKLKR